MRISLETMSVLSGAAVFETKATGFGCGIVLAAPVGTQKSRALSPSKLPQVSSAKA